MLIKKQDQMIVEENLVCLCFDFRLSSSFLDPLAVRYFVYSLPFTFVISFISRNLYNTINSHVDKGNRIEYISEDENLKGFSSLPKFRS